MRKPRLAVSSFRLRNFKAIRDSGVVKFTPLTVFIGNNGVGKSSLIEGLETLQTIATNGLDEAMQGWRGIEHVWNQAARHQFLPASKGQRDRYENPLEFEIRGDAEDDRYHALVTIGASWMTTSFVSC